MNSIKPNLNMKNLLSLLILLIPFLTNGAEKIVTETCTYCNGSGINVCFNCGGTGARLQRFYSIYGPYSLWVNCEICGGAKVAKCIFCLGEGETKHTIYVPDKPSGSTKKL